MVTYKVNINRGYGVFPKGKQLINELQSGPLGRNLVLGPNEQPNGWEPYLVRNEMTAWNGGPFSIELNVVKKRQGHYFEAMTWRYA